MFGGVMNDVWKLRVSALLGALGVALGAFGAHGLKAVLSAVPNGMENWKTAVLYHLLHAVVMLVLAMHGGMVRAWWLLLSGVLAFSGSLYLMVPLGWKWLGPVTPVGGVLLMAGWVTVALRAGKLRGFPPRGEK